MQYSCRLLRCTQRASPALVPVMKPRNFSSSPSHPTNNHIRPYSGSLPSPGYEWCQRCHIPCRRLQKAIPVESSSTLNTNHSSGSTDACMNMPGICAAARQYYQRQLTNMAFLTALCFVALPGVTFGSDFDDDDEDDHV